MPCAKSADRDLAQQCQVVREIVDAVEATRARDGGDPERIDQERIGQDLPDRLPPELQEGHLQPGDQRSPDPHRAFFDPQAMAARQTWAKGLKDDSGRTVQAALKRASELGAMRRVARPPYPRVLDDIERDFPHCAEVLAFIRKRCALCSVVPDGPMQLPPILLNGPPGTGKTALAQRLARWLNVPVVQLDMSTVETSFKINGLDSGYASGKPGLIWDALDQECISPVVLLDELDKCAATNRHDGLGWLLGLLEPSTASSYRDSCLGLPVDASYIHWIATCNDLDPIDRPLLSRFRVFDVYAPTQEHMRAVARSVWRQMRTMQPWALAFEVELRGDVLDALAQRTPREIRQALEDALAQAALEGRRRLKVEDLPTARSEVKRPMGFIR